LFSENILSLVFVQGLVGWMMMDGLDDGYMDALMIGWLGD